MTIPFLDFFKKLTGRSGNSGTAVADVPTKPSRVIRPKKSEAERLSKTVLPNATRSFGAPDPFRSAAATSPGPRSSMPLELGARKITASAPRSRPAQLPPALARALEPKLERTISLRVADLIDVVPAGFIKPVEILDANAIVSLKASEIEKGMPDKHPTISLPSLYQQVPEIFLRSVRPDDDTRVELPYQKVLEQFQAAQVRTDQVREQAIPHVDTPILTATIEDSRRFGTKIQPIESSSLPAVPVKHATARAIAEAEPDATPAESAPPAKSSPSGLRIISLHSPALTPKSEIPSPSPTAANIPFELSPNGTGASVSERVPASGGPPVPTPLPFTPELAKLALESPKVEKPATKEPEKKAETTASSVKATTAAPVPAPTKESKEKPFTLPLSKTSDAQVNLSATKEPEKKTEPAGSSAKVTTVEPVAAQKTLPKGKPLALRPETDLDKPAELSLPKEPISSAPKLDVAPEPATEAPSISFSLKAVLQNLPAFQLSGDIAAISDDVRLTFPLALIEPQLASGRVSIAPDIFQAALPEQYREFFHIDGAKTTVALPLEEVLKNLPATVLKLRDDQETAAIDKDFETPFYLKAQEDARRFPPKAESTDKTAAETAKVDTTSSEKVDPKEIVAQANALAGVKGCAITFSDGLSLAGELPENAEADGLSAMAPSMLERIAQHVHETKLGRLVAMTLYATDSAVSFFSRGNVCLTALHDGPLTSEVRSRLAELIEKLSRTYAQPENPNVDH